MGPRIAADVWLPADLEPGQKVPTMLRAARYWRSYQPGPMAQIFQVLGMDMGRTTAASSAPMPPGEIAEFSFNLYPTSVLIKEGHRLRVAVAGHDASVFDRYPAQGTPLLSVQRNSVYSSYIELPVMARE